MQSYKKDYSALETSDEPVKVTIPFGNYTLTSLVKALNTAITAILSLAEDDVFKQDLFVTKVDFKDYNGLVTFEIIGLDELSLKSKGSGSYNPTTNIISNYSKTIYSGIYVLTDNYTGLLETLGFNVSYLSPLLTGKPHYGFGVKLDPRIDVTGTEADPIITPNYAVDGNWAAPINASNAYSINTLGYFTSGSVANLSYPNCIYISIDGIQTKNKTTLPNIGNVFATIPVPLLFGSKICHMPYTSFIHNLPNFNLNSLTVRTIDENGELINWNGCFWKLVLGLTWTTDYARESQDRMQDKMMKPPVFGGYYDPLTTEEEAYRKRARIGYQYS